MRLEPYSYGSYVHGIMDGEIVAEYGDGKRVLKEFCLV
jgi:hypothetical protein